MAMLTCATVLIAPENWENAKLRAFFADGRMENEHEEEKWHSRYECGYWQLYNCQ